MVITDKIKNNSIHGDKLYKTTRIVLFSLFSISSLNTTKKNIKESKVLIINIMVIGIRKNKLITSFNYFLVKMQLRTLQLLS